MITGAHVIIYSVNADADRAFLRDVVGFPYVDAGQGWLIFELPPSEVAFHPGAENDRHDLYLMCDDIETEMTSLASRGVVCLPAHKERWGVVTRITLPGGGHIGLY